MTDKKRPRLAKAETVDPMLRTPKRFCSNVECDELIPDDAPKQQKFHNDACRQKWNRRLKDRRSNAKKQNKRTKELRKYIKDDPEKVGDIARKVIHDEVAKAAGPLIREYVASAMVDMTSLLPAVVENLRDGLNSRSFIERRHAEALVLKYAMDYYQSDSKDDTGVKIVIEQQGVKVESEGAGISVQDGKVVEEFESDWETCYVCDTRYPPENLAKDGDRGVICSTCRAQKYLQSGESLTTDKLFGDTILYGDVPTSPESFNSNEKPEDE